MPVITTIGDIMRMPRSEAARGRRVVLRAVVTYADPVYRDFFVQAGDDAISMWHPQVAGGVDQGDVIEFEGVTSAGEFAPKIEPDQATVRVVGRSALPPARPLTIGDVSNGTYDCRFLSVEGVVRGQVQHAGQLELSLATAFGRIRVLVPRVFADEPAAPPVGAFVRVRGAMATDLTATQQFAGIRVYAQSLEQVDMLERGPGPDLPQRTLGQLARYDPSLHSFGRVQTEGVVTLARDDGSFFLEDASGAALVVPFVQNGKVPEAARVTGFMSVEGALIVLRDAELEPMERPAVVAPLVVDRVAQLHDRALDARLVQVRAQVLDLALEADEAVIVALFPGSDERFEARLPRGLVAGQEQRVGAGALLRLTGVKLPVASALRGVSRPVLLCGSRSQVEILAAPPFWTPARLWAVAAALLAALGAVIAAARLRLRALARRHAEVQALVHARTRELGEARDDLVALHRMRTHFVAMAAHDVRSPLTSVLAGLGLLRMLEPSSPRREPLVASMLSAAERIRDIVDRFLSIQSAELKRLEPERVVVDLHEVARATILRLSARAELKRQRMELNAPEGPAEVVGDPLLLSHALDNLLDNALKFAPEGGHVAVELAVQGQFVLITVDDDGPGIRPDERSGLFQPFGKLSALPTGQEASTGLGLSFVKLWVEAMAGTVEVSDAPSGGARFRLRFARARDRVASHAA